MKLHLKLNNKDGIYWDMSKPLSYNAFLHLIMGGRGIGKTTQGFTYCFSKYNKNREQFIYLRRYKTEIKTFVSKNSLNKIVDGTFFKGDGAGGYNVCCEDDIVGYCIPLSVTRSYKSTNFDRVTTIIYDEAIVARGGRYVYLPNEVIMFLEFISTVVRTRTNVRIFILGNNEDLFNPYTEYFNIPLFKGRIYYDPERKIYIELAKNSPKLLEEEKKTSLFDLLQGTDYAGYHYENKLLNDGKGNIIERPNNLSLYARLTFQKETLNLYTYTKENNIWLYVERKEKLIYDDYTFKIYSSQGIHYFNIDRYKKSIGNFVYRLYYDDRIGYCDERAVSLLAYVVENF